MDRKKISLHIFLFLATFLSLTLAGADWVSGTSLGFDMSWDYFLTGFAYSVPFICILTFHEFGHYFTAKYHSIEVSLPYYIPFWLGFIGLPTPGTMGAFIRMYRGVSNRISYFDIGVSGPIFGFIVTIMVLWYGFTYLPPLDHIYQIHPHLAQSSTVIAEAHANNFISIYLGETLLFNFMKDWFADPNLLPPASEYIHYPWIMAGYFGLFLTALNLLPIGQLDGGHVIFGLFGEKYHTIISKVVFTIFLFYAGLGFITFESLSDTSTNGIMSFMITVIIYVGVVYFSSQKIVPDRKKQLIYTTTLITAQFFCSSVFNVEGYPGWIAFAFIIGRFLGVGHPIVVDNKKLGMNRKIVGWLALAIFVLCFSPKPLYLM